MAKMKRTPVRGPQRSNTRSGDSPSLFGRGADLSETLGSLLRTTIEQAGVVRDALERSARSGRAKFDEARGDRRRHAALVELGEIVLDLVRRGEIELSELPEIADVVRELDTMDDEERQGEPVAAESRRPASPSSPHERRTESRDPQQRVWRPSQSDVAVARERSGRMTQPESLRARVQREADGTIAALRQQVSSSERSASDDRNLSHGAAPRGGISFDDDLQDYMHPDDVPGSDGSSKP
jgi:hypothetical protein